MIRAVVTGDKVELLAEDLYAELIPSMERKVKEASDLLALRLKQTVGRSTSTPGGPPAKRTGELQRSLNPLPVRRTKTSVRAGAGVWVDNAEERQRIARKAAALEYGGKDKKGRVHPPYPFLRPTEEAAREEILRILEDV